MSRINEKQIDEFFNELCGHYFGDYKGRVPAYRHKNPDGSIGGWVANTARVDPTVYIGYNAEVFGTATILYDAKIIDNAKIGSACFINGNIFNGDYCIISDNAMLKGTHVFLASKIGGNSKIINCNVTNQSKITGNSKLQKCNISNSFLKDVIAKKTSFFKNK